ncbi:MAG TPA: dihydroneopterin aldolase [Sandaracinaceae bacterium LLY-WYZ-13_1]|nr:dihydroneopterin aldolase [Sandaracinaceae bacterium LLY-WYZ-13_1]
MGRARDIIAIEGLRVDCVVGVYPHERHRVQPLEVSVRMAVDTRRAGREESFAETVDYAATANQIAFLLRSCRFFMLETAARALTRLLLAPPSPGEPRARVQEVKLRLTKPYALAGHGVPSLEVHRDASDVVLGHETKPFGTVDVLDETKHVGVYRLNVAPGRGIPLHVHRQMKESELILSEGLLCQGAPVAAGTVFQWPKEAPHRYDNPTDRWQSILCVDSPPFLPEDEIEVEGEPADVKPQPPFIPGAVRAT